MLAPDEVQRRVERGYRDALGAWVWYPRRTGWSVPEAPGRVFDTAIVDSERQSSYPYYAFAFGPYRLRDDLQSAFARYLPSNSIFRGVDRVKLIKGVMEADRKARGAQVSLVELLNRRVLAAAFPLQWAARERRRRERGRARGICHTRATRKITQWSATASPRGTGSSTCCRSVPTRRSPGRLT